MLLLLFCMAVSAGGYDTAKRDSILSVITGAHMPKKKVNILKYGAKGDGKKDCLPAFKKAMAQSKKNGGLHIVVPAGTYYLQGPIHFESNTCLELSEGAILRFSPDPQFYLPMVKTSWEGTFLQNYSPFIYGYGLHDISIRRLPSLNATSVKDRGCVRS